MNKFGLSQRNMQDIIQTAAAIPEISGLMIFGSRAMGNFKPGSDIDLACLGSKIDQHTVQKLQQILNEERPIPYFIDIVNYDQLKNEDLKKHIDEYGISIYIRKAGTIH